MPRCKLTKERLVTLRRLMSLGLGSRAIWRTGGLGVSRQTIQGWMQRLGDPAVVKRMMARVAVAERNDREPSWKNDRQQTEVERVINQLGRVGGRPSRCPHCRCLAILVAVRGWRGCYRCYLQNQQAAG